MSLAELSESEAFLARVTKACAPFRKTASSFARTEVADIELRDALETFPTLFPQWVGRLDQYDGRRYGPLLGVSDEGSAGEVIAAAAQGAAKARALGAPDAAAIGVTIDGERMTSAGEVPIGPDEYKEVVSAAFGRTYCTTNVGVRVNTRIYQPLPEFRVQKGADGVPALAEQILARFEPFLGQTGGNPRRLTVRLVIDQDVSEDVLKQLVTTVDTARAERKRISDASVHRLSLLLIFENEINAGRDLDAIKRALRTASSLGIGELAIDGEVLEPARRRLSVTGLLNVLSPSTLQVLLNEAKRLRVRLAHRYAVDDETAARTVWTGLHTARTYGMSAAKYGLVPLMLEDQKQIVRMVASWTQGWTAIPAFYVDTPLLSETDCYDETRCAEAAELWMKTVSEAGAKVVLVDSPDRITPRRLIRPDQRLPDDPGVLTLAEITRLHDFSEKLGLKVLWSGGITPLQAYELAKLGVGGIFTTSSTAERIAVGAVLERDPQLPFENEPTDGGVRRIHALIQAGFLAGALGEAPLVQQIEENAQKLLAAIGARQRDEIIGAVAVLDQLLIDGWKEHWTNLDQKTG